MFPMLLDLYEHPIKLIPVNVEKNGEFFHYTVYLQYESPFYAFKYTSKNNVYGLDDPDNHFTTDLDFIIQSKKRGLVLTYRKANIQMEFTLDNESKLVEITPILSPVFPGEKYYQNR